MVWRSQAPPVSNRSRRCYAPEGIDACGLADGVAWAGRALRPGPRRASFGNVAEFTRFCVPDSILARRIPLRRQNPPGRDLYRGVQ